MSWLRRLFRRAKSPPRKVARSYRVGNVSLREAKSLARILVKPGIGFYEPDVSLSLHQSGEKYEGLYKTRPNKRVLRMHAIVHALHLKAWHDAGLQMRRHSPVFEMEHVLFDLLEERQMWDGTRGGDPKVSWKELKKMLKSNKRVDAGLFPYQLATAIAQHFPTRKSASIAMYQMYQVPEINTILRKIGNRFPTRENLRLIINYFEKESAKARAGSTS